ncbi:hypothetical protein [Halobellus sp. Atlit-38R]|jgi:hypothetical protein|nr:hypothetical protein [Halobellus sp. Atlit-38R]
MRPSPFRAKEVEYLCYVLLVLLGGALLLWFALDYVQLIETVAENAPW